jgi:hypothetical protein
MKSFKINEISVVKSPVQKHALATIIKGGAVDDDGVGSEAIEITEEQLGKMIDDAVKAAATNLITTIQTQQAEIENLKKAAAKRSVTNTENMTEWDLAVADYAERHRLSKNEATLEFSATPEGNTLYKRLRDKPFAVVPRTPEPISKAAQATAKLNETFVETARAYHPGLSKHDAVLAYLDSEIGKTAYTKFARDLHNASHLT